jgi:hypothetical protein
VQLILEFWAGTGERPDRVPVLIFNFGPIFSGTPYADECGVRDIMWREESGVIDPRLADFTRGLDRLLMLTSEFVAHDSSFAISNASAADLIREDIRRLEEYHANLISRDGKPVHLYSYELSKATVIHIGEILGQIKTAYIERFIVDTYKPAELRLLVLSRQLLADWCELLSSLKGSTFTPLDNVV